MAENSNTKFAEAEAEAECIFSYNNSEGTKCVPINQLPPPFMKEAIEHIKEYGSCPQLNVNICFIIACYNTVTGNETVDGVYNDICSECRKKLKTKNSYKCNYCNTRNHPCSKNGDIQTCVRCNNTNISP